MTEQRETYSPLLTRAVSIVAACMALHLLVNTQVTLLSHIPNLNLHLAFALTIVFLKRIERSRNRVFLFAVCILLSLAVTGYIHWNEEALLDREGAPNEVDTFVGILIIVLVITAAVLSFGWLLPGLAVFSLAYAYLGPYFPGVFFHGGIDPVKIVAMLTTGLQGIYGTLLFVSVTYVAIFLVFGSFLEKSGGARFFVDFPLSLMEGVKAGGGYAAVVSSALMGMGSGSPTANVLTTGTFTIPLMKRSGFLPHVAGGIEAVASSGGQIMPPVMGAVAFVMAEFLGVSYVKIIGHAVIPALVFYIVIGVNVWLRSAKMDIQPLPKGSLPVFGDVLRGGWKFVLPIVILVAFLVVGYTPGLAAFWAIVALVAVSLPGWRVALPLLALVGFLSLLFPSMWLLWIVLALIVLGWPGRFGGHSFDVVGQALSEGGRNAADFAVILACLSIPVKVITATGVGLKLPLLVSEYAGGLLPVGYLITAGASVILGMGLPTVAAFIVVSVLAVPALVDLGASNLHANFFVLYFSVFSAITPPVALAALAGSRVAESDYFKTCIASLQFGTVGYLIPFYFVFNSALLGLDTWPRILWTVALTLASLVALSASIHGYMLVSASFFQRVLLFLAAAMLAAAVMQGGLLWAGLGFLLILTVGAWQAGALFSATARR